MKIMKVHNKELPIPSFFQVYNIGGGSGDKLREIVYADLTGNTPALFNYFYVSNHIPHLFQNRYFDDISNFSTFGDLINNIRNQLICSKKYIYSKYNKVSFDFNTKVLLLDSGAANIVKYVAENVHYNADAFLPSLLKHMIDYYDYADRTKFDIVIGFDLGGKYSFRDGEKKNQQLIDFYDKLDKDKINKYLLKETVKYLKNKPDFYPYVMATIHGQSPKDYAAYTQYVLNLEKQSGYSFWGFALGGIASHKSVGQAWSSDCNFSQKGTKKIQNAYLAAKATKIVHSLVGDRPIHALGCGSYPNIILNYYFGATSFDSATPSRRVGDGNSLSTSYVFCPNPPKKMNGKNVNFSKMLIGDYNADHSLKSGGFDYINLYTINDDIPLCGCSACSKVPNIHAIKALYASKEKDKEAFYYSKQIMNAHAVLQHRILCEIISRYPGFNEYHADNQTTLANLLNYFYKHLSEES